MAETAPTATEINCETGEVTVRPLTAEEIAAAEAREAAATQQRGEDEAAAAAKAAARASAEAKLTAIGLTPDEITALTK